MFANFEMDITFVDPMMGFYSLAFPITKISHKYRRYIKIIIDIKIY